VRGVPSGCDRAKAHTTVCWRSLHRRCLRCHRGRCRPGPTEPLPSTGVSWRRTPSNATTPTPVVGQPPPHHRAHSGDRWRPRQPPPARPARSADRPDPRLVNLTIDAGHDVHSTHPEAFLAALLPFLTRSPISHRTRTHTHRCRNPAVCQQLHDSANFGSPAITVGDFTCGREGSVLSVRR